MNTQEFVNRESERRKRLKRIEKAFIEMIQKYIQIFVFCLPMFVIFSPYFPISKFMKFLALFWGCLGWITTVELINKK
jgi:hypothetical protein